MAELNKWQKREAEQYAKENDVSYDAAVKELFPPDPAPEAPEPEPEAPEPEPEAPASGAKAKVTK